MQPGAVFPAGLLVDIRASAVPPCYHAVQGFATGTRAPARKGRNMDALSTSYSPRLASAPALLLIPKDPAIALAKATRLDLEATLHQNEGCTWHADRHSHLALELRCRAAGERA